MHACAFIYITCACVSPIIFFFTMYPAGQRNEHEVKARMADDADELQTMTAHTDSARARHPASQCDEYEVKTWMADSADESQKVAAHSDSARPRYPANQRDANEDNVRLADGAGKLAQPICRGVVRGGTSCVRSWPGLCVCVWSCAWS